VGAEVGRYSPGDQARSNLLESENNEMRTAIVHLTSRSRVRFQKEKKSWRHRPSGERLKKKKRVKGTVCAGKTGKVLLQKKGIYPVIRDGKTKNSPTAFQRLSYVTTYKQNQSP